jgi:hypothetical protein
MLRAVGTLLLLALANDGGCGGGKTDSTADAGLTPVEQCQEYAATWCTKAFNCYAQVGRVDQDTATANIPDCEQVIQDKLPCSGVTAVSGDYDTCITQIKGMSCSKWDVPQTQFGTVTPPASCDNALSFE